MKQSEKLDAILKYLYEKRDDGREYSILEILQGLGIDTNHNEVARLADQLNKDKYIDLNDLSSKLKKAKINAKGITYCEEDSYASKGHNITNHYQITNNNSPNSNVVINSNQVSITQNQQQQAENILKEMREAIAKDTVIPKDRKEEVLECITEVESGISTGKKPKFALRNLLTMAAETASIASLGVSLAQLLQQMP